MNCRRLLELMWTAPLVPVLGMQLAAITFIVVHLGTFTFLLTSYMLISYYTDISAFEVAPACIQTQ